MRLSKSQISQLSKWATGGRLIVRPIMPPEDVPAWAKREFDLARALVKVATTKPRKKASEVAS